MEKRQEPTAKKPWVTPKLKRIRAGSAEAIINQGVKDGGSGFFHSS